MDIDAHDLCYHGYRSRRSIHLIWWLYRSHVSITELLTIVRRHPAQLFCAHSGDQVVVHQEVW